MGISTSLLSQKKKRQEMKEKDRGLLIIAILSMQAARGGFLKVVVILFTFQIDKQN